jgi:hypothetical protein
MRATTEHQRPPDIVPVEILLTAGKISFALYELMEGDNSELHFLSSRPKQKLVSRRTCSKVLLEEFLKCVYEDEVINKQC